MMKKRINPILVCVLLLTMMFAAMVTLLPETVAATTFTLNPSADGHELDWTPKSGSDHYLMVDDGYDGVDDDATYLSVGGSNNEDYWHVNDHTSESGAISNVRLYLRLYQDNGEEFAFCISNGSTENIGSDQSTTTSWATYYTDYATNPLRGGADWSWTDIDNLQIGISSEAAGGWGGTEYVTVAWANVTYSAAAPASLTVTLRQSDNTQERIDVGFFGNVTATPGGSDVNSTNFVRAQCDDCDGTDDSFWINWSGTTWSSAKTGDTINIDNNFIFFYYETTSGSADPDDGGWSWSDSGVDADGNYQITFDNSGTTYVWVRYRIESIPSPLSGCDDYKQDYTVELDR